MAKTSRSERNPRLGPSNLELDDFTVGSSRILAKTNFKQVSCSLCAAQSWPINIDSDLELTDLKSLRVRMYNTEKLTRRRARKKSLSLWFFSKPRFLQTEIFKHHRPCSISDTVSLQWKLGPMRSR